MKILLLLPILAYISLVIFNIDILQETQIINFFNFFEISIPTILYSSIFLVWFLIFSFIIFDLKWAFLNRKINKLEEETFALKAELYDKKEDILKKFIAEYQIKMDSFTKEQKELFEKFKVENEKDLVRQKAETDRILEKLNLLDKWIFDKIKDSFKTKN